MMPSGINISILDRNPQRNQSAFTLVELLVVIGIIGILASLLLPALAGAKMKSYTARCSSNVRQVVMAVMSYTGDNDGDTPGCASRNAYGFQNADWIYWRTTPGYPPLQSSPLAPYFGGINDRLFRCAGDRYDGDRISLTGDAANGPYFYSYSMNSYDIVGGRNLGMTSIFQGPPAAPTAYKFAFDTVNNPSGKIMLAEEQSSLSSAEAPYAAGVPVRSMVVQDGRWTNADILTVRHSDRANAGFADGHTELVTWQFGQDPNNSRPDL